MKPLILVSIPFELLKERYLKLVLENSINVEISLKAEVLDSFTRKEFKEIAKLLKSNHLKTTVHLPFFDLSIGALDPWIREVSLKRIFLALERIKFFEPLNLVLHTGYYLEHYERRSEWLKFFMEGVLKIMESCQEMGLSLSLENVFEPEPEFLKSVFETLPGLFWCFDPAHARVFSDRDELYWLEVLSPYLKEIHCHDNLGKRDDHLALGKGVLRFSEIFNFVKENSFQEILLTVEAHNEEDAQLSWKFLNEVF